MKFKNYLSLLCLLILINVQASFAGTAFTTGFDGYNGTIATVPAGWYISFNSASSFYTSAGNYGVSAPSYKFGNDSDYVITPAAAGIDSISFFAKGNGSPFSVLNELQFYKSTDSSNWTLITSIDSLPTSGTTLTIGLGNNPQPTWLKIVYHKAGNGNLAFDDVTVTSPLVSGILSTPESTKINVYPTPTTGVVNVSIPSANGNNVKIELFDILGNKVEARVEKIQAGQYTFNLKGQRQGFYFVRIQTDKQTVSKRITLTQEN